MTAPFRRCACGASYTYAGWQALEFAGHQCVGTGDTLEMRGCSACQSTLVIQVLPVPADVDEALRAWEEEISERKGWRDDD